MDRRRRRRYNESRRPNSTGSIVVAGVSGGCILLYAAFMTLAVFNAGDTANILGGLAVLVMLASLVCLGYGIHNFRDDSFNKTSRWIGLILSVLATFLWLILYIMGLLMG